MKRSWQNALVTGASSGIGRSLAIAIARGGVPVLLAARRRAELEESAELVTRAGGSARVVELDVSDTERTVDQIRRLDDETGGLDLVVANAGVGASRRDLPSYAWENIRDALHTNLCGAAATLTAALPRMVARGRGHLVGIGSLASYGALPESEAYCTPKAGLSMLLECLRLDLVGTGVDVTHVELGFVRTPMVSRSTHPMPQLAEPDSVAAHVVGRLRRAPRTIVFPRALAAATRALAALPSPVREAIALRTRSRGS